jgi:hypothetical protein
MDKADKPDRGWHYWRRWTRPDVPRPGWEKEQVIEAFREWQDVEHYFHEVTDPGLVDHAIYLLKAAEEKYRACLMRARNPGA